MDESYRLVTFGDGEGVAPAADLAALHAELLPQSPLTRLGRRFLAQAYYRMLAEDGLIFGAVAYVGGKPVGFICATGDAGGLVRAVLGRSFFRWAGAAGRTVLTAPRRLAAVWEIVRIMWFRPRQACEGEILSLGVLPQYRGAEFTRWTGRHIAADLMDHVMAWFQERGIPTIRAIADYDNTVAHRFYRHHGGRIVNENVKGWRVPSVEFILRPAR